MPSRVAIVAAPDAAEPLLAQLAGERPLWVADTLANRAAVERLREAAPTAGVTIFQVDPVATPDEWAATVLGTVVEHHRAQSQEPRVDTLELHGVVMTDALRAELAAHDFTDVSGDGEIMVARIPAPHHP